MPSTKTDMAVVAASVVGMADQIMQGVRDQRERQPDAATGHYLRAAVAGAIALGAAEMLRRDENHDRRHHHQPPLGSDGRPAKPGDHDGHTRDMLAEAAGAYALGRQMLGHNDHHILKLIAEGLGAVALAKEADRDLVD